MQLAQLSSQLRPRLVPEIETILASAETPLIANMAESRQVAGGERLCSVSSTSLCNPESGCPPTFLQDAHQDEHQDMHQPS